MGEIGKLEDILMREFLGLFQDVSNLEMRNRRNRGIGIGIGIGGGGGDGRRK